MVPEVLAHRHMEHGNRMTETEGRGRAKWGAQTVYVRAQSPRPTRPACCTLEVMVVQTGALRSTGRSKSRGTKDYGKMIFERRRAGLLPGKTEGKMCGTLLLLPFPPSKFLEYRCVDAPRLGASPK